MSAVLRNDRGHILPGQPSLNPTGRPRVPDDVRQELQEIFTAAAPHAARVLVALIDDDDTRVSTAAAIHVLDRLLGKVTQSIDANIRSDAIGQIHLAALEEIRQRRAARLAAEGSHSGMIEITPDSGTK